MTPLLIATVAVVLIYLLRPPAQKILVPSTLLWEQLVEQSANRRRLLRWLASLALSALIVLLAVSVFFRLEPGSGSIMHPILLIDNTGSMASLVRPGEPTTRLDLARQKALDILDRSSGTITIADLAGTVGPVRFENVADARRLVASIQPSITAEPRIPDHLSGTASDQPASKTFLLTDAATLPDGFRESASPFPTALEIVDVSVPAENLGITHFSVTPILPGIINTTADSAYLEILNGGDQRATGRLSLEVLPAHQVVEQSGVQPIHLLSRVLDIEAGAPWSAALDLHQAYAAFPYQAIAVRATVRLTRADLPGGDVQALDDQAWLILQPAKTLLRSPSDSGQPLPRWLRRIISTSERLDLVKPRVDADTPVVLYRQLPLVPEPPCMLLPPTLEEGGTSSKALNLDRTTLALPTRLPLQLPWTQVVALVETAPQAPTSWITGETITAQSPTPRLGENPPDSAQDDTHARLVVDLLHGPSANSPCTTWSFDPLASQLETRAEFPVLVESVLAATAAAYRRTTSRSEAKQPDQQLVAGNWRPLAEPTDASVASFLFLRNGQLTAREPLGATVTLVRGAQADPSAPAGTNNAPLLAADTTASDLDIASESPGRFWRWPGRTTALLLIVVLLLAEAATRFAGITE